MKIHMKDKVLGKVFFPILLETVLLMLSGIVDTLMLSNVSDDAVASVGTANTYIGLVLVLFMVISNGLIAVMSQYIGAKKQGYATQARNIAIIINGISGLTMSLLLLFLSRNIIISSNIADNLRNDAILYLKIVGAGIILDALIVVGSCNLRAFDKSQYSLIAVITGNVINLILNSIFIFGFKFGVLGVSISTIIGKSFNLLLCFIFGKILIKEKQYTERTSYKTLIKQIFKIGLPAALESAMYSAMLTVIVIILAGMDKNGFSTKAKTYATQLTNFSYCVGLALAQATVIINGWKIGDNKVKECYFQTHKAAIVGISCGVLFELAFAISSPWLLRAFTNDTNLIKTITIILYIDIAIEVGKATSLVYGMTLKSTGDSIFPTIIAFIFNTTFAIGGAYLFGIVLKLGAVGVYLALMLDECTRATLLFFRFKSGKWEQKIVIKKYHNNELENIE